MTQKKQMKVVIVDDERDAVEALSIMLNDFVEEVEIIGTSNSVLNATKLINETKPDIVFLDVEMPYANGFDLLDIVSYKDFQLVLTTAYNHYAIKAIKVNAVDYLMKPIDIDELVIAVEKTRELKEKQLVPLNANFNLKKEVVAPISKIPIAIKGDYIFLDLEDIQYIQSEGSYSIIWTFDKRYMTAKNLKYHELLLAGSNFLRLGNSYLVNIEKVIKYLKEDGGMVQLQNKSKIPVARNRKKDLKRRLKF